MKLYEIILKPLSGFGSPIKGDTLFGQFCWQIANDPDCSTKLDDFIRAYSQSPFVIFSSAFPGYSGFPHFVFKKPDVPSHKFPTDSEANCISKLKARKEKKAGKWFLVGKTPGTAHLDTVDLKDIHPISDDGLAEQLAEQMKRDKAYPPFEFSKHAPMPHNKINRLTGTTGTGEFAPFVMENSYFHPDPGVELVVFALIDETLIEPEKVRQLMEIMGKCGYGRDASVGMGRFEVAAMSPMVFSANHEPNAIYTLAPCIPPKNSFGNAWFTPFTRFGKHGNYLASSRKPFKSPVIMADEGAIFEPEDASVFEKMYFGEAITGVSNAMTNAVVQGYTPFLPIKLAKQDGETR